MVLIIFVLVSLIISPSATIMTFGRASGYFTITFDDTSETTGGQTIACCLRVREPSTRAAEGSGIGVFVGNIPVPPSEVVAVVAVVMVVLR